MTVSVGNEHTREECVQRLGEHPWSRQSKWGENGAYSRGHLGFFFAQV